MSIPAITPAQRANEALKGVIQVYRDHHEGKRYTLFVSVNLVGTGSDIYDQNHRGQCRDNTVSEYTFLSLSANSLDYLHSFYLKNEYARSFATTAWHFIWDNQQDELALLLNSTGF